MKSHVIIVAAGSGTRFGGDIPKQFRLLAGRPLLMHTVDAYRSGDASGCDTSLRGITLVLNPDHEAMWRQLCDRYGFVSPPVAYGGATRWQSVRNALACVDADADVVLVHDGARPLVSPGLIARVEREASLCHAVVPAVPVTDSLLRCGDDGATCTVQRQGIYAVQTPQGFDAALLRRAYAQPYSAVYTDDASVVRAAGHSVYMCEGESGNIKVTNPCDIRVAEAIMSGC